MRMLKSYSKQNHQTVQLAPTQLTLLYGWLQCWLGHTIQTRFANLNITNMKILHKVVIKRWEVRRIVFLNQAKIVLHMYIKVSVLHHTDLNYLWHKGKGFLSYTKCSGCSRILDRQCKSFFLCIFHLISPMRCKYTESTYSKITKRLQCFI